VVDGFTEKTYSGCLVLAGGLKKIDSLLFDEHYIVLVFPFSFDFDVR
jgi:hypothetical protein